MATVAKLKDWKEDEDVKLAGECTFTIVAKDFKATDLTTRHRFKEALKLKCQFDDKPFKTKRVNIGGADVEWKNFEWKSEYVCLNMRFLHDKFFHVEGYCQHDKGEIFGRLSVDLYTIATGPPDHNLPLLDHNNKSVGRLQFRIEMEQVTNVALIFRSIKLKGLAMVEKDQNYGLNPYCKYGYSRDWPLIKSGKMKAVYSETRHKTTDPEWENDLPEVRFKTSLRELLQESLILHLTHKGKFQNTTISRCNLLFRTLVNKKIRDEEKIVFAGKLKPNNAQINGTLIFRSLPKLAQMKPSNPMRKAVHTEKGIYDATVFLPGMPLPKANLLQSEDRRVVDTRTVSHLDSPGRYKKKTSARDVFQEVENEKKESPKSGGGPTRPKFEPLSAPAKPKPKPQPVVDNLISFTPPMSRHKRSASDGKDSPKPFQELPPGVGEVNPFADFEAPRKHRGSLIFKVEDDSNNPFLPKPEVFEPKKEDESYNPFA